jgi:hypothetical protein
MEKRPRLRRIWMNILKNPPFPHPPIHTQPRLRSQLRALMDDKPMHFIFKIFFAPIL